MKLFHTPTSPYVRKVMVFAHETGLSSRITTTFLRPVPMKADATLSRDNPLSKIPALTTDDGVVLYDSGVICEYMDTLHDGPRLIPQAGPERWQALRIQALCNGILEAAILVFYERTLRPEGLRWTAWMDGQLEKVTQGLDALERDAATFGEKVELPQICAGATVGWLAFRNSLVEPTAGRPTLAKWYDQFAARESMRATVPHM